MSDTWQAMCHNAWQRPMHVGHMACHVCDTWHVMCQHAWHMEKAINMVWELFVEAGSSKKEKEGKKRERERKERKRGNEKRERRRRKGEIKKEKRKAVFQWLELVRPRSKVRIFDESCAPRVKDSSYLGFFLSFELLFWSAFGTTLCHVYGMFWVLIGIWPILWSQLRRGCSRSKGLLPKRIGVENLPVRELPKCSYNPRAHYCMD